MKERQRVNAYMQEYGLHGIYQGHTAHGDYPLLHLRGLLILDYLIETPHFARAAAEVNTITHLWGGEHVQVETPEPGAINIQASHPEIVNLVRQHITNAARDLQRHFSMADELGAADGGLENLKFLQAFGDFDTELPLGTATPLQGGLASLSREERLDRARALRGQTVEDTHVARDFSRRQDAQDRILLMFPPSQDAGLDVAPPLSDEEVMDLAQREQVMRAEGTLYGDGELEF